MSLAGAGLADFLVDRDLAKMLGNSLADTGLDLCELMVKGSDLQTWTVESYMPGWASSLLAMVGPWGDVTGITDIYSQIPVLQDAFYFVTSPIICEPPGWLGAGGGSVIWSPQGAACLAPALQWASLMMGCRPWSLSR